MTHLHIRLLGPFQVARSGRAITAFETTKARALLAYLAVEADRPHQREALAEMLWPGRPEGAARANLRHTLASLRRTIGDHARSAGHDADSPFFLTTQKTIQFNIASDAWVDVAEFEILIAQGTAASFLDLSQVEDAVELYRGSFLEDLSIEDSVAFEEWALLKREQLGRQMLDALGRLTEWYTQRGEYETALHHARRRLELEPWDEEGQRQVMRLLALDGRRSGALAQYETCRQVLAEELGVEPEEGTTVLYERIRDGEELPAPSPLALHNLPAQVTPFVGREAELAEIGKLLRDPACRHLSLVGPGGSGKTRLALEAAADILSGAQVSDYEHGVYFVSLAPLRSPDTIVSAVAQAIGFSFHGEGEARQQLLDYVRRKHLLLILDNFEHLLSYIPSPEREGSENKGGESLIVDILETAPGVKVLTTSRARLNLRGEHLFPVGGMDLPPLLSCEDEEQYDAVELFATGARRAEQGFELTDDNVEDVVRVCRLVEGMPLGILLAVAWTRMLTPGEIADQVSGEIEEGVDFLATEERDVPARQRSMRATLDHSWRLLTEREQEVFRALSVFRGGFTREAARRVTGASLHELMALANKSLLRRAPTGRYEIHELLRQYAADKLRRAEKLDREPVAGKAARDLHCTYYTAALQRWATDLKSARRRATLAEMNVEIENARAAWDWAVEQVQVERLDRAMEGLCLYYWQRWRTLEGEAACRMAASKLAATLDKLRIGADEVSADEASVAEGLRVWAKVLAWQGSFNKWLGHLELCRQLTHQSLAVLERPELANRDIRAEKAFALLRMRKITWHFISDYEQIRWMDEQSLALYRAVGDRWWTAKLLEALCDDLIDMVCALDEASRAAKESLAIGRELGDPTIVARSLVNLGQVALSLGQIEEAERLFRESIPIYQGMSTRADSTGELLRVGRGLFWLGKFDEAHSLLEENLATGSDLGIIMSVAFYTTRLAHAKAHLGQYEQARVQAQIGCTFFQERLGLEDGFAFFGLGIVALAERAYAEAGQLLEKSIAVSRRSNSWDLLGWGLSVLGYAERGLGQPDRAWQHLVEALRTAAETKLFRPCLFVLPGIALLLADRGEKERAVELYGLASRYEFVGNSRWFADVAGRHIAAVAAALPPDVVAAAQERGRARDLDATVAELLVELEKRQNQGVKSQF